MLQSYNPENKELADLAKKYKEPLRQVEKLILCRNGEVEGNLYLASRVRLERLR